MAGNGPGGAAQLGDQSESTAKSDSITKTTTTATEVAEATEATRASTGNHMPKNSFFVANEEPHAEHESLYDEMGGLHRSVAMAIDSSVFQSFMAFVIILTIFMVTHDTNVRASGTPPPLWLEVVNNTIVAIFTVEIILRVFVERLAFFPKGWNCFDLFVVVSDVASFLLTLLVGDVLTSLTFLRILRIGRVLRLFRVFMRFPELNMLVHGIASAMKAIFWATIMIVMCLVVWSIIAVDMIHPVAKDVEERGGFDGCTRCPRAFSSVAQATLTFLQTIIAGDSWGMYVLPIVEQSPWTIVFFLMVIATVQLGLMNLILAVIVDRAQAARLEDTQLQLSEKSEKFHSERELLYKCCKLMDRDDDGLLHPEDLKFGYDAIPEFNDLMKLLNIKRNDLDTVFMILDVDGSQEISYSEFIEQLYLTRSAEQQALFIYTVHNVNRLIREQTSEIVNVLRADLQGLFGPEVLQTPYASPMASAAQGARSSTARTIDTPGKPSCPVAPGPTIDPAPKCEASLAWTPEDATAMLALEEEIRNDLGQLQEKVSRQSANLDRICSLPPEKKQASMTCLVLRNLPALETRVREEANSMLAKLSMQGAHLAELQGLSDRCLVPNGLGPICKPPFYGDGNCQIVQIETSRDCAHTLAIERM